MSTTNEHPVGEVDGRFSDPTAGPTPWDEAIATLAEAELYWLTTVRADGRPHVTPLIAVWHDGAIHFCTGLQEQKARNLEHERHVALTTGTNAWDAGLDVVVEGSVRRITADDELRTLADRWLEKYGEDWRFEVRDGAFDGGGGPAGVFRIDADKLLAFAKAPHAQTTFRLRAAG